MLKTNNKLLIRAIKSIKDMKPVEEQRYINLQTEENMLYQDWIGDVCREINLGNEYLSKWHLIIKKIKRFFRKLKGDK